MIDDVEQTVAAADSLMSQGFEIARDLSNKLALVITASKVRASINLGGRAWSVSVPTCYYGRTAGLCGLCDGQSDNDFWDGMKV